MKQDIVDLIYEDADLSDDGLQMRVWKIQPITMSLAGNEIRYRVPVNIWVKKDLTFAAAEVTLPMLALISFEPAATC